jgi:EAL domain-containing protein (putative c-di-GMP-specific phosphodiesterase class I)
VDAASISAEKLLTALAAPYRIEDHDRFVTVSIGISIYPEDGKDAAALIKAADVAMYHAKESGRNNCRFFTSDMNRRSIERLSIVSGLRQALERDEFILYYQPKTNLETEAVIGAEALIRWRHPERGLVGPIAFIAIAEECNLIRPIGRWVLQEACRQLAAWLDAGLQPVPVAVNISAAEFRNTQLVENIREALSNMELDPRYLQLELTESMLMEDVDAAAAVLKELKSIGVECAIDDFGTGFSSLSYLRHFPIGVLKIDQSFVHEITACRSNATIVRAVIGMCQGLRCRSIAEGVETLEQAEFLRASHCTEAQGYYFGRPMAANDFSKFLRPR